MNIRKVDKKGENVEMKEQNELQVTLDELKLLLDDETYLRLTCLQS